MLLSIRPCHVDDILAGRKTIELRRTRPAVMPGQPVAIYATTPAAALVATCRIARVESAPPGQLWDFVANQAAISRGHYDGYFDNAERAHALHLENVERLADHVSLKQLRSAGGFRPPQTWRFVDRQQLQTMLGVHPASEALFSLLPSTNVA